MLSMSGVSSYVWLSLDTIQAFSVVICLYHVVKVCVIVTDRYQNKHISNCFIELQILVCIHCQC